jgi:hypothetical protein
MAKEDVVLQRLIEIGRCCGVEINVIRAKVMRI